MRCFETEFQGWLKRNEQLIASITFTILFLLGYWFSGCVFLKHLTLEQSNYCREVVKQACNDNAGYISALPEEVNLKKIGNKVEVGIDGYVGKVTAKVKGKTITFGYDTELLYVVLISFAMGIGFVIVPILFFLFIIVICYGVERLKEKRRK